METTMRSRIWMVIAATVTLLVCAGPAMTMEKGEFFQIIQNNALLQTIHAQDPDKAQSLALEAEKLLVASQSDEPAAREPQLRFRGGSQASKPDRSAESDILRRNRKAYEQNPILKDIYYRSPLASLRMLKRLREAAEVN